MDKQQCFMTKWLSQNKVVQKETDESVIITEIFETSEDKAHGNDGSTSPEKCKYHNSIKFYEFFERYRSFMF